MLKALETGVRGGKWHSLYDKVYGLSNLKAAWQQVKANRGGGGVDKMSIADFDKNAEARLEKLSEALRTCPASTKTAGSRQLRTAGCGLRFVIG